MLPRESNADLIQRLQQWRAGSQRDLAMTGLFTGAAKDIRRRGRAVGGLGAAWAELAPGHLVERTEVVGVSRGVLTIRVADTGSKFELDRWLRCGGETALIERAGAALLRVKLVTHTPPPPPPSAQRGTRTPPPRPPLR
ncbi:hypothetical protein BH11PLA1_BH11PLA1_21350 [soil metagenome]